MCVCVFCVVLKRQTQFENYLKHFYAFKTDAYYSDFSSNFGLKLFFLKTSKMVITKSIVCLSKCQFMNLNRFYQIFTNDLTSVTLRTKSII